MKTPSSSDIQELFNQLAPRYDLFNRLTSLGQDRRWRRAVLEPLQKGMRVLDVGCGTGDLCLAALRQCGPSVDVVGIDFSASMLEIARRRYREAGFNGARAMCFLEKKAEEIPFETEPYDLVVSGFVLRNIYQNIDRILDGIYRALKPGGRIQFLDITEPGNPILRFGGKIYLHTLTAFYGKILFGKRYPVSYLSQSAQRFPKPEEFKNKLKEKGFVDIRTKFFMFGMIVLYEAIRS